MHSTQLGGVASLLQDGGKQGAWVNMKHTLLAIPGAIKAVVFM
jgi:hypothetical protein